MGSPILGHHPQKGQPVSALTKEQIDFLKSQKISLRDVFDATGLTRSQYQTAMEATGQHFACGVTPCTAAGHRLRSKSGDCIQCNTVKIAFTLRHYKDAVVYIAGSYERRLIKVGLTTDRQKRELELCKYAYGGASDWEMLAWAKTKNAGKVEFMVHSTLQTFRVPGTYTRNGYKQDCYEIFRCSYKEAKGAVLNCLPADAELTAPKEERGLRVYAFGPA